MGFGPAEFGVVSSAASSCLLVRSVGGGLRKKRSKVFSDFHSSGASRWFFRQLRPFLPAYSIGVLLLVCEQLAIFVDPCCSNG